jgi:hypothetical protein
VVPVDQVVTLANKVQAGNHAYNGHCNVTSQICASAVTADSAAIKDGCQRRCDRKHSWSASEQDLNRVGRAVFVEIDLDAIVENFNLLRAVCRNKDVGKVSITTTRPS